jgi:hypothetical protein
VHRTGSNVVNGRYYVDDSPKGTLAHYSAFRRIDVPGLRKRYQAQKAMTPAEALKGSPLAPGAGVMSLPIYFMSAQSPDNASANAIVGALNAEGYWPAPLGYNSNPYKGPGGKTPAPGDFSQTHVGDDTDTSPYLDPKLTGISTDAYIRNMSALIRSLGTTR